MTWIDIDAENAALANEESKVISSFHPAVSAVSRSLMQRIRFKETDEVDSWLPQFSPLTLHYPILKAEAFGFHDEKAAAHSRSHIYFFSFTQSSRIGNSTSR